MPPLLKLKDRVFYGWVVVLVVFISSFIMMGVNSSFGVFFKSFEGAFNLNRATTSAILSGRMVASCVFAFLGGWAIDRYGPRIVFSVMGLFIGLSMVLTGRVSDSWQIFISYSLLLAVGISPSYVVTSSTILRWFNRKRGLALGIASSGGGLGIALVAPLAAFLTEEFGWRQALMILGGFIWLVMIPVAQLLKKDPDEIGALPDGVIKTLEPVTVEKNDHRIPAFTLRQTLRTRNFWAFLFVWVLLAFSGFFVLTHVFPHATDLGFSPGQAATIISLTGVTMTIGRLVTGFIIDRVNAKLTAILFSLVQAVMFVSLVWAQELWMLNLFGILYGFTIGGFSIATTILIGEAFGLADIGKLLGLLEIGIFIGAGIGPFLGGLIFDISNSYNVAFLMMGATVLARVLPVALIRRQTGSRIPVSQDYIP